MQSALRDDATPAALSASIGDRITQRLRDAIVFADLLPGTHLKQEELARQFGTSRVPLREAMRQLAAEGLIDWTSNRTAVVRSLAIAEIQDLFELAAILEPRATRLGVPNLSDDDIRVLGELNLKMEAERSSLRRWYESNLQFHLLPMLRADRRHSVEMVKSIRANLTRFFMIPAIYGDPDDLWHAQHRQVHGALLEAFGRRDARRAKQLVEEDWRDAWTYWAPLLEKGLLSAADGREDGPKPQSSPR